MHIYIFNKLLGYHQRDIFMEKVPQRDILLDFLWNRLPLEQPSGNFQHSMEYSPSQP